MCHQPGPCWDVPTTAEHRICWDVAVGTGFPLRPSCSHQDSASPAVRKVYPSRGLSMQAQVELYQTGPGSAGCPGARILPGKKKRAPSPAPDQGSTGADVSITQETCMDTPRAVPGAALLTWSTISPHPNPSPCAGNAPRCLPRPYPTPGARGARGHPTLLSPRNWAGESRNRVGFGAGWGSWRRCWGCWGAVGAWAQAGAAGHCQVTSAGARKSDSRCIRSAVLQFQFHRLTIIFRLLLVPH